MKNIFTTITIIFLLFDYSFAQAPDILWTKTFGGMESDVGISVHQISNGGYILAGSTSSYGAGDSDVWLIMTDENGDELWNKTFGGNATDYGLSAQQTLDGGYIICGMTASFGAGDFDVWLIKTDGNGDELWNKTFGGSEIDAGQAVNQTIDGGYIIAGYTLPSGASLIDAWLIKTDENGNEVWNNTYGGDKLDRFSSVQQTSDSGYVATGFTESFGATFWDFIFIKANSFGDELWVNTYGGSGYDACNSVLQTSDGGYFLVGSTSSYGMGDRDLWLIKTDENGNELWNKTFGGTDNDNGSSVIQTSDGDYVITGSTSSYGSGNSDIWLIKINENGRETWSTTYGETENEYSASVQQTFDGGYIICGTTGQLGPAEDSDIFLIKTKPDPTSINIDQNYPDVTSYSLNQNYPNPFNPSTTIKFSLPFSGYATLKIYNALGEEVAVLLDKELTTGTYEVEWNAINVPSGVYFYQLKTGEYVDTKKMILLR